MFEYDICNQADEEIFVKQCSALEKNVPGLIKKDTVTDVDKSMIQPYELSGSTIMVYMDNVVGAVYIKSEIELEQFFN